MPFGLVAWVGCVATTVLWAGGASSDIAGRGWRLEKPGPFACSITFPFGRNGRAEPLLSVGTGGAGDVIFVYYHSEERISLGWEQLGGGVIYSDPIDVAFAQPHRLMFSLGSLMPPEGNSLYTARPECAALRETVLVQLDGRTVLAAHGTFRPFVPGGVAIGANVVGGAVAGAFFSGGITEVTPIDPRAVLDAGSVLTNFLQHRTNKATAGPLGAIGLENYPGPVLIRLRFPRGLAGQSEPLVVTGKTGAGDIIYVRYDNDHQVRFGYDHWSVGGPVSDPVEIDPDRTQELLVSMGSMLPSASEGNGDAYARLRHQCLVFLNGQRVLRCSSRFYPTLPTQIIIAANPIGGSTARSRFSGVILHVEPVRPEDIPTTAP